MTLIPLEHERRLASAAEAEAWFRALGDDHVSARGFHTRDAARFEALVRAIEPKRENTISFEGGTLDATARDALDAFAMSSFQYLDLRTSEGELRVWPGVQQWVCSARDRSAPHEMDSIPTALRRFRELGAERVERGFVMGVQDAAKPLLVDLLRALGTRVDAVLVVDVGVARQLTELYAGETLDWQASGMLVDFPSGRIHGFLVTPNAGERDRDAWRERVDKALRRARLA